MGSKAIAERAANMESMPIYCLNLTSEYGIMTLIFLLMIEIRCRVLGLGLRMFIGMCLINFGLGWQVRDRLLVCIFLERFRYFIDFPSFIVHYFSLFS